MNASAQTAGGLARSAGGIAQSALYLVVVLAVANAVTFVDRQVLTLLIDPIKGHLGATDTAMGVLQGPAFALFYAFIGLFLGRLVDRTNRIRLLLIGLALWCGLTVGCAFANDYWVMFACRTGVGVGEAVLTPAAASLMADRVAPEYRARAMSAFIGGQAMGAGLALIGAGALVAWLAALAGSDGLLHGFAPWQWAFIACGALALPLVLLILPIREPARTESVHAAADRTVSASAADWAVLRPRLRTLAGIMIAFCLLGVVGWGAGGWLPTFFMRRFELGIGTVGPVYGLILMIMAPLGAMAGGALTDRLKRRGRDDAAVIVGLVGTVGMCGAVIATTQMPTAALAWVTLGAYTFFSPFPFGTVYAAITEMTPNSYRGQAVAVYALGLNVFGFGLGPTTVGWANDRLFPGPAGVGDSLTLLAIAYGSLAAVAFLLVRARYARDVARL